MKQIDERRFTAEENKTFVHKVTKDRIGNGIYIGENDSIENYTEEPMNESELVEFNSIHKNEVENNERQKQKR